MNNYPGLPEELYKECRAVLLLCSELDSNRSLQRVFVTEELYPFQNRVPDTSSKEERVDAVVHLLANQRVNDGRSVLAIFLTILRDKYREGDSRRDELTVLINAFSSTSRAPPVSDEHAGRLDQEQISGATLDLSELLNQITDPYIKAIEEELRMNPTHWQKNKFEPPAHAESFTAAYFLQQSDKTLRLRDTIYEFQQKLESINFGNVPLVEQANAVLNHIVEQSTQTRQLIGVVSEHPLSITAEKAISQVIEDARKMQRTLNRAALAVAGGRGLSAELHNQLIVAVQTLVVSLGELDQQLRQISNDARMASLFLN